MKLIESFAAAVLIVAGAAGIVAAVLWCCRRLSGLRALAGQLPALVPVRHAYRGRYSGQPAPVTPGAAAADTGADAALSASPRADDRAAPLSQPGAATAATPRGLGQPSRRPPWHTAPMPAASAAVEIPAQAANDDWAPVNPIRPWMLFDGPITRERCAEWLAGRALYEAPSS